MFAHFWLFRRERVWINGIMVVCGAFLFFLLVTGCILKIGRDSLCNSLMQNVPNVTRLDTHSHVAPTPPRRCKTTPENHSEMKWLLTSSVFVSPSVAIKPRANNGPLLSREESSTTACTKLRSAGLFLNFSLVWNPTVFHFSISEGSDCSYWSRRLLSASALPDGSVGQLLLLALHRSAAHLPEASELQVKDDGRRCERAGRKPFRWPGGDGCGDGALFQSSREATVRTSPRRPRAVHILQEIVVSEYLR